MVALMDVKMAARSAVVTVDSSAHQMADKRAVQKVDSMVVSLEHQLVE